MNKINLSNNLYELRRNCGLSQEEFAERLNVSRQAVSKWERGEAYPDTDNLIAISDMFGVTIDELLRSDNINISESDIKNEADGASETDNGFFRVNVNDKVRLDLGGEITVDDSDGKVKVNLGDNGITVNSDEGVQIKLGKHGIHIHEDADDDDDDDDEDDDFSGIRIRNGHINIGFDEKEARQNSSLSFWYKVPYPIITVIAFLAIGLFFNGWYWAWTLFMTIPIYYSLLDAIRKRKYDEFAYTIFAAFVYCLLGMLFSWWHPGWIIFITIPVYGAIAEALDK